uniref:Uncharacterized protein n=1 Tax=Arundo donax TaxID=35708 RepID=A0A0A8YLL1_ARUDO
MKSSSFFKQMRHSTQFAIPLDHGIETLMKIKKIYYIKMIKGLPPEVR